MQLIREGVQVASLIGALSAEEITLGELSEALRMLTPEAAQVFAFTLGCVLTESEMPCPRLASARARALRIAAQRRPLS